MCLLGFMGAGKSTVGRIVADSLELPFVDLDDALAERWGPVAVQLQREGEAVFRARERAEVARWCDGSARVLALGGGTWMDATSRAMLSRCAATVWLRAPLEVLSGRVGGDPSRPLWDERVAALHAAREPVYALAQHVVDAVGDPREVAEAVRRVVRGRDR